jgi:8-oxo-dGTP pyrophosphatase MutT (NUDIX family)
MNQQPARDPQVPAALAATVILLRDATAGLEVWLLRRVRALAFAGGASVFPGGRVDPADFDDCADFDGCAGSAAAIRFGCSPGEARALTMAAIRETFEETGVLLTRPVLAAAPDERGRQDLRRRVEAHELTFAAALTSLDSAVDAELIRPWARWITPAGERRRYDTHFYVAALPAGATAYPETTEASDARWITPAAALAEHERGERPMLPPTLVVLSELTAFERVPDVLAASDARTLAPVEPGLVTTDGVVEAVLPDGRRFPLRTAGS